MLVITTLIAIAFATQCKELTPGVYSVIDAFECINSVSLSLEKATNIQHSLQSLFQTYVFKDILKNPPQPSFDNKFFPTLDIDAQLASLPLLEDQAVYPFMQKIQYIVDTTHDLHLSFRLTSNENNTYYYDNFYASLPFTIDIVDGNYIIHPNSQLSSLGGKIPEEITNNDGKIITSINGDKPHTFVKKWAEDHAFLKSPHGRFTYALESMSFVSLRSNLLSQEFLSQPINILLTGDVSISTQYQMVYIPPQTLNEHIARKISQKERRSTAPISIEDFVTYKKSDKVFDLESSDGNLACKFDSEKKVNTIVLKTFYPEVEFDNFFEVFNKCIKTIDENTNPIIVILPMNGGGYADLEANFEQVLAPHADVDLIGSVRISKGSEGCMKNEYGEYLYDTDNCQVLYNETNKSIPLGEWYTQPKITHYGDVEHVYSQNTLMHASTMLEAKLVKNPRNPTDVIIMTDGFCYSACSVLAKGMVNKGNAIVVGYEGDPELSLESFDAGNSPTPVITQDEVFMDEAKVLAELGGYMRISFFETFEWNYNYNETIPREFVLNPVDERVNIFKYSPSKIDQFVDEGLKIYKKYQSECNPLNKRLVKVDSACDNNITIEHAHGGHICGDDGKWSTECVASYCEPGYKFDRFNNKCIVDVCFQESSSSESLFSDDLFWVIVGCVGGFIVIGIILAIIVITGIIVHKKHRLDTYDSL
ncbi:hypothetical protein EHI8A_050920 [Entamoeba histolytica HM-1:IMSS-B]|uniref:Uncharacterized protein n=6 Tax=Entamoeba histolytica TaxID=5759 RepID=C4M9G6_ENTH1|nr:hypothetical protein EHI_067600 [Entamoeba histolytica HM-1:IMSS]EMD48292.1 Hypothetical protein EHI5A_079010 [Entamoeba histolytica KU27]EMH76311.1 hypothetical protein EHI8A_050920 [Entamoeba histolytica HM-1:IMSS-B]EMS14339.1 hypothetical protein KM1_102460 [Entamoeba histolytica HM-3:IMSS]ENY64192.1 hypothetical protein EHI7A_051300 [Entamoeba histolytica HM-1:IMSS-A]GAT98310.1 hypothetical protein CL6EHI_067600 [Entamoeba histolytica]|eukprot:XP_657149.1 hypothetical protein EHI_067600 [Entamoeba histolytica HM-1:IMSS]